MRNTRSRHQLTRTIIIIIIISSLANSDPDPLQDYCIADINSSPIGPTCLDPTTATPDHFTTSTLSKPGNTSTNPFGFSLTLTTTHNLPGSNTQGLTMARIDIAPNGLVPPHSHPRASEVTTCLKGEILVGFVDTGGRQFSQRLKPGESFVFPKGLMHFLYNVGGGGEVAMAVSGLNSQNPGVQVAPTASFGAKPPVVDQVLEKAYMISGLDVWMIRRKLGGGG